MVNLVAAEKLLGARFPGSVLFGGDHFLSL